MIDSNRMGTYTIDKKWRCKTVIKNDICYKYVHKSNVLLIMKFREGGCCV